MFGKILTMMVIGISIACAKPNYQDTPAAAKEQKLESTGSSTSKQLWYHLTWEKVPTETDMGSFRLEFFESNLEDHAVELPGELKVVLWMPSMGHGSSPVKVEKLSSGVYRVDNVFFVMPGQWEIRMQIKNGNTVLDEIIEKITI